MGFIPLPMPDIIAYTEGEAAHPELWDKLRGCWVPGLFAGPVWDFSDSKDGAVLAAAMPSTKIHGVRTGIKSGEEFNGTSDYASLTMTQTISTVPLGGWTLVIKLRRYVNSPSASTQTGIAHFGNSESNSHYPWWTDDKLYIDLLSNVRVMSAVTNTFDLTKWHDLTVTSISGGSSTDWNCFQAGLKIGTGTPGDWFFSIDDTQKIGSSGAGLSYFFPGQIRHVLLYNRILDLETIQRLSNDPFYTPYTARVSTAFKTPPPAGNPWYYNHQQKVVA